MIPFAFNDVFICIILGPTNFFKHTVFTLCYDVTLVPTIYSSYPIIVTTTTVLVEIKISGWLINDEIVLENMVTVRNHDPHTSCKLNYKLN